MMVYLVHHAHAVDAAIDSRRPLSTAGLAQVAWLAEQARVRGVRPASIWHSGKLRSRQTAEAFLRACNASAAFRAARGLLPGDPTVWMENALALEDDDVLVVGHMPHLPSLARAMAADVQLPLHGMVALERTGAATFELRWMLGPS